MINLQAKGTFQELIKKYLEENASEALTEKINQGNKTLNGVENFIKGEAKKQASAGCACIEDKVVYGWAVHYFEEDSIKENQIKKEEAKVQTPTDIKNMNEPKRTSEIRKEKKAAEPKAAASKDVLNTEQMSIFDFLGE